MVAVCSTRIAMFFGQSLIYVFNIKGGTPDVPLLCMWVATGYVVRRFVFRLCILSPYSPGYHSAAFTAWIAFTQQVISGRF